MNVWLDNLKLVSSLERNMSATDTDWPLLGFTDDLRPAWRRELKRRSVALVTIVSLEGGGPRPVGSQMVVSETVAEGFLSGGCIEKDVTLHARECLRDGEPRHLIYGRGSPWFDIKLLCGARIELLVEPIHPGDPAAETLFQLTDSRQPAIWISDGSRRACQAPQRAERPWQGAIARHYDPVPRLVVVGHDPTALAIASLGIQAGFETLLVRPKGPSHPPPLVGLRYSRTAVTNALSPEHVDSWTAIAICSHDQDTDAEALNAALLTPARYIGLLGSRRRHPDLKHKLLNSGLSEETIQKIHMPIGLDLGGKAPFEIAISVLGEIIAKSHGKL